jgi:hypothetical protein
MKFSKKILLTVSSIGLLAMSSVASAGPVAPEYTEFGLFERATFGGDGIPNDPVAYSDFILDNGDVLTLGLSATNRFQNPVLGNDGAGTFFAEGGMNNGIPGEPGPESTWNFSFFAEIRDTDGNAITMPDPNSTFSALGLKLYYDLDAAFGTDKSDLGTIDIGVFDALTGGNGTLFQTSQNASFAYLSVDNAGFNEAPTFTSFNPNAGGEYSFALGFDGGQVAINVEVSEVSAPASALILLIGMAGLGALRLRKAS